MVDGRDSEGREGTGRDGTPDAPIARAKAPAANRSRPGAWREPFLIALAQHGDRDRAAGESGVRPKTVANTLTKDAGFRAAYDAAKAKGDATEVTTRVSWVPRFLAGLRAGGSIRFAARAVGVGRADVYALRRADPDFRELMQQALDDADDQLEYTARQRALGGSDRLMEVMLKAHMPDKYGDTLRLGRMLDQQAQLVYDEALAQGFTHEIAMAAVENFQKMIGAPLDG